MVSNNGYDVEGGLFDIMIPGGGFGAFDGCAETLGSNMGERYGGLLSECENEINLRSDEEIYTGRKQCLSKKCSKTFGSNELTLKGCMFLVDFMEAAGNLEL